MLVSLMRGQADSPARPVTGSKEKACCTISGRTLYLAFDGPMSVHLPLSRRGSSKGMMPFSSGLLQLKRDPRTWVQERIIIEYDL